MVKATANISDFIFLFAHGAGADKDSDWMLTISQQLSNAGLAVKRFNFPYMDKRALDGRRRPPDRMPQLLQAFQSQLANLAKNKRVIIGGKSMGGRVASLLLAEPQNLRKVDGLVCLGFPFHPPAKPDRYRGEHLKTIAVDTLILQGERDTFGTRSEVASYPFADKVRLTFLPDGDHSFKPRVKSGYSLLDNQQLAAQKIIEFIHSL